MNANDSNEEKIIFKELSYKITGLLFDVHNNLGRFCREKQYGDAFEGLLKGSKIDYQREMALPLKLVDNNLTNKVDFMVDGKILVELKTKPCVTKEDYYQMQRYLQASKSKLGLLVNFSVKYLHPIRIIRVNS